MTNQVDRVDYDSSEIGYYVDQTNRADVDHVSQERSHNIPSNNFQHNMANHNQQKLRPGI